MAGVDLNVVQRGEVQGIVREAQNTGRDKKQHLKSELKRRYPGIENVRIKRGGTVYNALDYLAEDSDSYG